MTATATATISQTELRTVEVRIPAGGTATGQTKTWAKRITGCSPTAKTGHDYQGPWLDDGKLVDLPQGTLVIVGGSTGSRKHPTKTANLYVVIDDGYLLCLERVQHDEWAVRLRDLTCEYLAMDWRERLRSSLQMRLEELEAAPQATSYALDQYRLAAQEGFQRPERIFVFGCWNNTQGWTPERIAEAVASGQKELARLEAAYQEELANHANLLKKTRKRLDDLAAQEAPAPAERPEVAAARTALALLTAEERAALLAEFAS